ncbi:ABC transporter permease [Isoptericola sp. NPDC057653]|uniref:ABC transporter permease n=1 Tax=Isoptericola sp. NPDC057653 TaxID=3346195 RepID=UPI0036882340
MTDLETARDDDVRADERRRAASAPPDAGAGYTARRGAALLRSHRAARSARADAKADLYEASQRTLVLRRFRRHRLAHVSLYLLVALYLCAIFAEFVAPYDKLHGFEDQKYAAPSQIHVVDEDGGWHLPFVYSSSTEIDQETFTYRTGVDTSDRHPVGLFVRGDEYELLGLIPMDVHLFGTTDGQPVFLTGADHLGRDSFSRIMVGSRISLLVGFGGVVVSFVLGLLIGGLSGYLGGRVDAVSQRFIDLIISIPLIPLWMALSAAVPQTWSGVQTYLAITLILSLVGWTGLARVVRGRIIALREEDYVTAARVSAMRTPGIIGRHMLPALTSYLIVHITIAIPGMILGETTLSFLGLGISAPDVSWGSLLQGAQDVTVVSNYPWLLAPAVVLVIAVILFNFVGDGLRDASDPYQN